MADIESKRVEKVAAEAEKEAKKLIKEEAEAPEREALVNFFYSKVIKIVGSRPFEI